MSSFPPPYPYFNGITYDSAFFNPSSSALTLAQANAKYLKKTTPDTATAVETFTNGIITDTLTSYGVFGGNILKDPGVGTQTYISSFGQNNSTVSFGASSGSCSLGSLANTSVNIGYNMSNGTNLTIATGATQDTNILIGTKNAIITGQNKIIIGGSGNALSLSSGTININSPLTLNYSYSPLPTINMLGYSFSNTTSFLTPASPVVGTLVCYSPIQYLSLPAGLYHIQYYGSTGGATTYFYASIGVIGGSTTIVSGTTTFSAVATYGVSMWNGTTPTQVGMTSTHFSNSAIIQLDGTKGVCVGYVSGTAGLTFNSGITAYRIA